MRWIVKHGDILKVPADVLVCSGNVFLNLSGGVGGEILLRQGDGMQKELHQFLSSNNRKFVKQGEVIATASFGLPFRAVLHAVAVDGFYQSSPTVVCETVCKGLQMAADLGATRVALTALATGFGRLTMSQFGQGLAPLMMREFPPIAEVVICVRNEDDCNALSREMSHGLGQ